MTTLTAYEEALQTIAKIENESMVGIATIMNGLRDAIVQAGDTLKATRDAMPVVLGPPTTVRANLDTWISQVQSTTYQIEQLAMAVQHNLNMYDALGTNQASTTTTPIYTTPYIPPMSPSTV